MKISEIVKEDVISVNDISHLRNRALAVAGLCDKVGTYPLIYRAFGQRKDATPIIKVTNDSKISDYIARSVMPISGYDKHYQLIKALDIKKPAFCTMKTPYSPSEFFGRARIFIPPEQYKVMWSPYVIDLGGNEVTEEYKDKYGMIQLTPNSYKLSPDRVIGPEMATTYVEGLPKQPTKNELIFDCPEYYLVDIELLLKKYSGKKAREIIYYPEITHSPHTFHNPTDQPITKKSIFKSINKEAFQARFKTYEDLSWYLKNSMIGYLNWMEKNNITRLT